ncbi:MAG: hypothetical protein GF403_08885 [Candidatus Coatesbacteria bacterium]|nr:hypothetical protein [Candidatus Coatesbacteria bacterium]
MSKAAFSKLVAPLTLLLAAGAAANLRAPGPADEPGTPEHALASFLTALFEDDAAVVAELYDTSPSWSGPWRELSADNRLFLAEALEPDLEYSYTPPRTVDGASSLEELLEPERAIVAAELILIVDDEWISRTYHFLLENREGDWRVILFDEAP